MVFSRLKLLVLEDVDGMVKFKHPPAGFFSLETKLLVGGWTNPFEKYANVKMGSSSPSFGVKLKNIWHHHLKKFGVHQLIAFVNLPLFCPVGRNPRISPARNMVVVDFRIWCPYIIILVTEKHGKGSVFTEYNLIIPFVCDMPRKTNLHRTP